MSCFAKAGSKDKEEKYKNRTDDTLSNLNEWIHTVVELIKTAESCSENVVTIKVFQLISEVSASRT